MRFKEFIHGAISEKAHNFLHHIAEEELIACKVVDLQLKRPGVIRFYAECLDVPREAGLQKDLSDKLTRRLKVQEVPGLGTVSAEVYNQLGPWGELGALKTAEFDK